MLCYTIPSLIPICTNALEMSVLCSSITLLLLRSLSPDNSLDLCANSRRSEWIDCLYSWFCPVVCAKIRLAFGNEREKGEGILTVTPSPSWLSMRKGYVRTLISCIAEARLAKRGRFVGSGRKGTKQRILGTTTLA